MNQDNYIKQGELLFRKDCVFVAAAAEPGRIPPPTLGEVAFAGRSNVGKSSLINALTFRKKLARSSNTPGRTQQINFFDLGGVFNLVDLPGYGYAVASKEKKHAWNKMVQDFLRSRQTLKRVCVLIDARHGFKAVDKETMEMLDATGVPYSIILTKIDKIKKSELDKLLLNVEEELKKHPAAFPRAFPTSSDKKTGIEELRAFFAEMFFKP